LAEKPHLLQPNVRKEELFGIAKSVENTSLMEIKSTQLGLTSRTEGPPSYAALLAKRPKLEVVAPVQPMDTSSSIEETPCSSKDLINIVATADIEDRKPSTTETVLVPPIQSVLTKPPPLVKITPAEPSISSSSTSVLNIPKWGSPQIAPQDLSIAGRSDSTPEDVIVSPNIQRAPIIVSAKRLSPSPSSSSAINPVTNQSMNDMGTSGESSQIARPLTKSVIVCHRPSVGSNV